MERPRLRPLEAFPIDEQGQRWVGLRDPAGLTDTVASLPPPVAAVVQLFDGSYTRDQICAEFERSYGRALDRAALDHLIEELDRALLLDSARFKAHEQLLLDAFSRADVRPAHLAGRSYPQDPRELAALLDGFYAAPRGPGPPASGTAPLVRALVAPHIDFQRGGISYAWAYRALADADRIPERIVVFGTDHQGTTQPFALTRKHYDTPLGRLRTDVALVDELCSRVARRLGPDAAAGLFADEAHHRAEHSIEFQMVWLRHALGARADEVELLPILCGSFSELVARGADPESYPPIAVLLDELTAALADRPTLFVAGADLAHVGPRFGDRQPLDRTARRSLAGRDHATLAAALRGDAKAWFGEIEREGDCRRVCGLAPVYAMLAAARPGPGELLAYDQCAADDARESWVTIASLAFC